MLRRRDKDGDFMTQAEEGVESDRWRFVHSMAPDEEDDEDGEGGEGPDEEEDEATACEIEVHNKSGEALLLCWVNADGKLHHFYPVHSAGAIQDGSVPSSHVEYTHVGHAFVCLRQHEGAASAGPKKMEDIDVDNFVFVYRPLMPGHRHVIYLDNVTGRGASVRSLPMDTEVIDTSKKQYKKKMMRGFTILYEDDVFRDYDKLGPLLDGDLQEIQSLLPKSVCRRLEKTTKIWLNKSLKYGSRSRPTEGHGACFHPMGGASWLRKNGICVDKEGCIEFYTIDDYIQSHKDWGKGGGLLHEFCHAFHNKIVPNGFDNEEIRDAYTAAMAKKKYDAVAVHGRKGTYKAYACANCMEFFAELSTAFLWKKDRKCEFNKWFPYNRSLLKDHDFETYTVLDRIWSQSIVASSSP